MDWAGASPKQPTNSSATLRTLTTAGKPEGRSSITTQLEQIPALWFGNAIEQIIFSANSHTFHSDFKAALTMP